jgi:hypothetical protein
MYFRYGDEDDDGKPVTLVGLKLMQVQNLGHDHMYKVLTL